MTDSIKGRLCLKPIPANIRANIGYDVRAKFHGRTGQEQGFYPPGQTIVNPATKSKTWIKVRWKNEDSINIASEVDFKCHVPNLLTGQNCVHGLSVHAASSAWLLFYKSILAKEIGAEACEAITLANMELTSVTLTYLVLCADREQAFQVVRDMGLAAELLYGAPGKHGKSKVTNMESSNPTLVLDKTPVVLKAYVKVNLEHCTIKDDSLKAQLTDEAERIVRIELTLGKTVLEEPIESIQELLPPRAKLTSPSAWKGGHQSGLYKAFYEWGVLKRLGLLIPGGQSGKSRALRKCRPDQKDLAQLNQQDHSAVLDYLAGRQVQASRGTLHRVLRTLRIDMTLPWSKHQQLPCYRLVEALRYGNRYQVPSHLAAKSFCQESWPELQERLQKEIESPSTADERTARLSSDESVVDE